MRNQEANYRQMKQNLTHGLEMLKNGIKYIHLSHMDILRLQCLVIHQCLSREDRIRASKNEYDAIKQKGGEPYYDDEEQCWKDSSELVAKGGNDNATEDDSVVDNIFNNF